ncbi:MAG: tripartite tricarboxylate transporter permease [Alphaproteobacteria bacterium]|nr:tripartite tricarboxylate transporter permease [Alphaproteobacteria bacterium]
MIDGVFWTALALVFEPQTLMVGLAAAMFGLFVGAVPGLSATMAVALLIPVTFFMPPVPALVAVVMTTAMAIFAGDIPSVLLRIPGTPASAAYTDDAFAMTKRGQGELAMGICLVTSAIGGLFGAVVLVLLAPILADFAIRFSSFEYFWLVLLGLTCAVFVCHGNMIKGTVSLLLGLFISTIGLDPLAGFPRFTFEVRDLYSGLPFIATMVGMFAVSEILRTVTALGQPLEVVKHQFGNVFAGVWRVLRRYHWNMWRGNAIGTAIGILPGAGADIAAWISYSVSKRFSRTPETFGKGSEEGLVDAGAANNAAVAGAWVPALVFGIPGDSVTAIVIGMLFLKGLQPGPMIFDNSPVETTALFIAFFVANLAMLPIGWLAIKASGYTLSIPRAYLMPIILLFCMVGSFAVNNDPFAILVMLVMGVVAFLMMENDIPIAPAILGMVLGDQLEKTFLTSLMKVDGEVSRLIERPIAAWLAAITVIIWAMMLWSAWRQWRAAKTRA